MSNKELVGRIIYDCLSSIEIYFHKTGLFDNASKKSPLRTIIFSHRRCQCRIRTLRAYRSGRRRAQQIFFMGLWCFFRGFLSHLWFSRIHWLNEGPLLERLPTGLLTGRQIAQSDTGSRLLFPILYENPQSFIKRVNLYCITSFKVT